MLKDSECEGCNKMHHGMVANISRFNTTFLKKLVLPIFIFKVYNVNTSSSKNSLGITLLIKINVFNHVSQIL